MINWIVFLVKKYSHKVKKKIDFLVWALRWLWKLSMRNPLEWQHLLCIMFTCTLLSVTVSDSSCYSSLLPPPARPQDVKFISFPSSLGCWALGAPGLCSERAHSQVRLQTDWPLRGSVRAGTGSGGHCEHLGAGVRQSGNDSHTQRGLEHPEEGTCPPIWGEPTCLPASAGKHWAFCFLDTAPLWLYNSCFS